MPREIIGVLILSFRSRIGHRDDQICDIHHFAPEDLTRCGGRGVENGQVANIAHLVVMMVDKSWCQLANDASGRGIVLHKSVFLVIPAEVSIKHYFGPARALLGATKQPKEAETSPDEISHELES